MRYLLGAVAAVSPALFGVVAGCAEEGRFYACTCEVVTDFDDASKLDVEVCAPSPERAPAVGRGCAQTGAPAYVQRCACAPMASSAVCRSGACKVIHR